MNHQQSNDPFYQSEFALFGTENVQRGSDPLDLDMMNFELFAAPNLVTGRGRNSSETQYAYSYYPDQTPNLENIGGLDMLSGVKEEQFSSCEGTEGNRFEDLFAKRIVLVEEEHGSSFTRSPSDVGDGGIGSTMSTINSINSINSTINRRINSTHTTIIGSGGEYEQGTRMAYYVVPSYLPSASEDPPAHPPGHISPPLMDPDTYSLEGVDMNRHVEFILGTARHFKRGKGKSQKAKKRGSPEGSVREPSPPVQVLPCVRRRKNKGQVRVLEDKFKAHVEWERDDILDLSNKTGLSELQVYKWCWDHKRKVPRLIE